MDSIRPVDVIAYSGYRANERPMYFRKHGKKIRIKKILKQWYEPEHHYFRIIGDDQRTYLLQWSLKTDEWLIREEI